MRPAPRLLPIIGVAIGGVLAVKALTGVAALPDLFSGSRALAEEAPTHGGRHAPPAQPAPAPPLPAAPAAARPMAPVCAQSPAELAKAAGLSPGELQTLQNLGARRGQLDDRERALDTQIQLLAAAETKVDGKVKALNTLKSEIQGLLGQQSQQQSAEVDRLVVVYSKMKPRDAAAVMATLDDRVRVPVAAKMKERNLADILSQMPTLEAKKLTELLAGRLPNPAVSQDDPPPGLPAQGREPATPAASLAADAPAASTPPKPARVAAVRRSQPRAQAAPRAEPAPRAAEARKRALARARVDTPILAAVRSASLPLARPAGQKAAQAASATARPLMPAPRPVLPAPTSTPTAG